MGQLFVWLYQTARRYVLMLAAIMLVLACGYWIRDEVQRIRNTSGAIAQLQGGLSDLNRHQSTLSGELSRRISELSGATLQQLDQRLSAIDASLRSLDVQLEQLRPKDVTSVISVLQSPPRQLELAAKASIELELLKQERAYLLGLRAYIEATTNRQSAQRRLESLRAVHRQAYSSLQSTAAELARLRQDSGLLHFIPFTAAYENREALETAVKELNSANTRAYEDFLAQQTLLNRLPTLDAITGFRLDERRLVNAVAPLRDGLLQLRNERAKNYAARIYDSALSSLPLASGILLGCLLVPAAIRSVFYYVCAPLAARRPPIVINVSKGTGRAAPAPGSSRSPDSSLISAVSQRIKLAPEQELLIRPDYCQSQPIGVSVRTKWLFNWSLWLTSIAAHLWMLKRFRTTEGAEIVVSSTIDALDEVALLEIRPGEAFVLQPRGIVGIMYRIGERPAVRRHWRLGTLHAWLTLQLRYLVFEGPVTLIVKGCRGVRLERAGAGRTVSQDATLGFSANTRYATIRAEPFIPYLRGKQALFQDRFDGEDAYYLYEEVPRNAHPGQNKGGPLEAMVDAGLKVFGI